jgi:CheY-like chemotaxis protein
METIPVTLLAFSEGISMPPSPQPHILAINESADVLNLFRELLEGEGYRVTEQLFVNKDLAAIHTLAPDAIILDYMWDHDDSGWALLQMLTMSPLTNDIPVVLCTGAIDRVAQLRAHLELMGVRVVTKPFNITDLLDTLGEVLDGAR